MLTDDQIARVANDAMRALQIATGAANPVSAWDEAEGWQRDSTLQAVAAGRAGDMADPRAEHERWMTERLTAGWTWGPVKDAEKKTNPTLVPYDELPETEKAKDRLMIGVVTALVPPAA